MIMTLDIDSKEATFLTKLIEILKPEYEDVVLMIVETKNGFHMLLKKPTLSFSANKLIRELSGSLQCDCSLSVCNRTCCFSGNETCNRRHKQPLRFACI
jgi:hypothetical protein